MKRNLIGVLNKHCLLSKTQDPLNLILDDGGDLTNMVLDRFPQFW